MSKVRQYFFWEPDLRDVDEKSEKSAASFDVACHTHRFNPGYTAFIEKSAYDKAVSALKQWHQFEKEQVAKDGPYEGKRINELIKMTADTLKDIGVSDE